MLLILVSSLACGNLAFWQNVNIETEKQAIIHVKTNLNDRVTSEGRNCLEAHYEKVRSPDGYWDRKLWEAVQNSDGTWTVAVGKRTGQMGEWHIKKSGKVVPGRSSVRGPGSC